MAERKPGIECMEAEVLTEVPGRTRALRVVEYALEMAHTLEENEEAAFQVGNLH